MKDSHPNIEFNFKCPRCHKISKVHPKGVDVCGWCVLEYTPQKRQEKEAHIRNLCKRVEKDS